ncbi:MAG: ATP phosphoribosyltransferase [Candidatus Woesearchaeota archaeon]
MKIKIALPKGRLLDSTKELFEKSKIYLELEERGYQPKSNLRNVEFYMLKPRDIPKMVELGFVDAGIVGKDLIEDEKARVNSMLDLKTMPVYLIVAGKKNSKNFHNNKTKIIVASEYAEIAKKYFRSKKIPFTLIKTHGATECFVPKFADIIVDHTQTGITLKKNKLKVFEIIMKSTTQFIVNKNLSEAKIKHAVMFKDKLCYGMKKMDLSYTEFLNEEKIMATLSN